MDATPTSEQALLDGEVREEAVCRHHWKIERPSGPVSKGVCRNCGEVRNFHNYIEGSSWGGSDKVLLENLSGGSRLPEGVGLSAREKQSQLAEDF